MPVNVKPLTGRLPARAPVLSDTGLIAIIAAGFLVLHILAGVFLMSGSAAATAVLEQDVLNKLYD